MVKILFLVKKVKKKTHHGCVKSEHVLYRPLIRPKGDIRTYICKKMQPPYCRSWETMSLRGTILVSRSGNLPVEAFS